MALGVVAATVCLLLVLAGASMGFSGSFAFSQPSPSGSSPAPSTEPAIFLLNPNGTYDPQFAITEPPRADDPREEPSFDPPKISDEFDGTDEAYHVVAVVANAPANALVEAYYQADGENEVTVGQLSPVPGSTDTYEFFWNIDEDTIAAGFGTFVVRLYSQTAGGFEELAADEVPVRMQHFDSLNLFEPIIEEAETVEILWPSQNGPLGFYKEDGAGTWRTVVNGTTSVGVRGESSPAGTQGDRNVYQVRFYYSVTPVGQAPEYTLCGEIGVSGARPDNSRTFAGTCSLVGKDVPSKVTAVAAMAVQDQEPDEPASEFAVGNVREPSQEGADAHRVQPYVPDPDELTIDLHSQPTGDAPTRRHDTAGLRCQTMVVSVTDVLERPVQGVNVDVHVTGTDDQLRFGEDSRNASNASGAKQAPDKGHPSNEFMADCDANDNGVGFPIASQGDHNVPGAPDTKHLESSLGTGLTGGGGTTFGQWRFHLYSTTVGDNSIVAWIDDEPLPVETEKRPADDDVIRTDDPQDANFVQWLPSAPAVSIDPTGATAQAGECQRFVIRVRGGTRPVRGANVDVHATGPDNGLDFCNPSDASPRRAPEQGVGHSPEDEGEVAHAGQPPVAQHTEGETSDQGNFVVGITSPVAGDTTLTAWYDGGEAPYDNDEFAAGEATATATTNWIVSAGDAAVSFLNPSPYGGGAGTNVSKTRDVDEAYHVVTRVSSVVPVAGVEIFYRSGTNPLVKIADATRVGQTDTWEAFWPANVADGPYTLVARIRDTTVTAEQSVTVRNNPDPLDPTVGPLQTVEIVSPLDGERATFVSGKLTVRGVTSAGAEGVTLYYTRAGSISTPQSAAWVQCGTMALPTGSAPKEFSAECTLAGADQPAMVTGVAALPYNCFGSCTADQTNESGDAHRVFGAEANPVLSIEPAETAADLGTCQKFVVSLHDQTGQPIPGQNLDAHLRGPGNSGNFCSPDDGTGTDRRAPNEGGHIADGDETDEAYHDEGGTRVHHTEAETTGNGRFILGIESRTEGDAQLTVWLDGNDNDAPEGDEVNDVSIMHWETEGICDITGTNGPDTLIGTDAPEKICGFGGRDTISGGGGNDTITGGPGGDKVRGNAGNDRVSGGPGNDRVFGGGGSDRLTGGRGRDIVNGHRKNDRLRGNGGNDRLDGGTGRDDCGGGRGRDRLRRCETGTRSFAARPRLI